MEQSLLLHTIYHLLKDFLPVNDITAIVLTFISNDVETCKYGSEIVENSIFAVDPNDSKGDGNITRLIESC